jgi:hypothetical protein
LETHWELKEHIENLMGENKIHKNQIAPFIHPTFLKRKTNEPLGEDITLIQNGHHMKN